MSQSMWGKKGWLLKVIFVFFNTKTCLNLKDAYASLKETDQILFHIYSG